jgi:hypothetical protein
VTNNNQSLTTEEPNKTITIKDDDEVLFLNIN